jgi:hypothetical protein
MHFLSQFFHLEMLLLLLAAPKKRRTRELLIA